MRLDFASALLALLLIVPTAPLRAQDEEEETAGEETARQESATEETAACAPQRAFDWSRIGLSNEKKKELGAKACQWYID